MQLLKEHGGHGMMIVHYIWCVWMRGRNVKGQRQEEIRRRKDLDSILWTNFFIHKDHIQKCMKTDFHMRSEWAGDSSRFFPSRMYGTQFERRVVWMYCLLGSSL